MERFVIEKEKRFVPHPVLFIDLGSWAESRHTTPLTACIYQAEYSRSQSGVFRNAHLSKTAPLWPYFLLDYSSPLDKLSRSVFSH